MSERQIEKAEQWRCPDCGHGELAPEEIQYLRTLERDISDLLAETRVARDERDEALATLAAVRELAESPRIHMTDVSDGSGLVSAASILALLDGEGEK